MRAKTSFFLLFVSVLSAFAHEKTTKIHVYVALCDNENQGIVRVSKSLGNGQNPKTNLYWGALYGVKTHFKKKASDWKLVESIDLPSEIILQRVVFKSKSHNAIMLADAYDGAKIKQCTIDFLNASSGIVDSLKIDEKMQAFGGASDLICYIGHDGLMDFDLDMNLKPKNTNNRKTIILACISKSYFSDFIKDSGAYPLLWTTGLMAPEAYTLEAAIAGFLNKETNEQIRQSAAEAYHKYQKCGVNAAKRLLVTGW